MSHYAQEGEVIRLLYPRFDYAKAMPTPWGKADSKHLVTIGVYDVSTPGHGGILVGKKIAKSLLSEKAIKAGMAWGQWIAFEEDCDWALFAYEQPQLYADHWNKNRTPNSPELQITTEKIREEARECIKRWHADYFIV